jgi:hypothetical protein
METDFDESGGVDAQEGVPVGAGFAKVRDGCAVPRFLLRSHPCAMDGIAAYGEFNATMVAFQQPLGESEINLSYRALAESVGKFGVREIIFGDEYHAGSLLVETVNNTGAQGTCRLRERLPAAEKGVDKRASGIAGSSVNGHAGGFVDGHEVVIFIEDVQRDGFGFGAERRAFGCVESDAFAAVKMEGAFAGGGAVDEHEARFNEFLDAGAGEFGTVRGDETVQASARVFPRDEQFAVGEWHGKIV